MRFNSLCNTFTPQIKGNNRAIYLILPSSPGHYNDIALSTGHYNDIARESDSFELFDLLSDL